MAKRVSNEADEADGASAYRKRQKITHEVPAGEDVYSVEQLRNLLAFDQDLRRARHGLQSFKRLLDSIVASDAESQLDILQQYLDSVKPRNPDEESVYLPDIMEMWSFAVQVNNDGVMSSVAVVLALVLQVVSGSLHLVPHGLGICQTLLQERQLKSLSKNMSCEKNKGFVISPTLRLLREAVSLDGGAYAKRIFRARQFTFTSLPRNLEITPLSDAPEDVRKTSVRTNAARYLLACLKYLHSDGRKELMAQRELLSHLTFMLRTDPPYLVVEILDTLKTHLLMDDRIPREVKLKSFNTKTLVRILGLYAYGTSAQPEEERSMVSDKAHEFILYICTTPGAGVLYPSTGMYPKPSEDGVSSGRSQKAGLDDSSLLDAKFTQEIPVYNFVLSEFAQKLKPWSSLRHCELLVAIFKAAPELIADYFLNTRSFTFEPKLSMTWIGYAAFLFNTMQIPLPGSFGDRTRYAAAPPPTSILLDNIIPLPINPKVLNRCFTLNSNLTSFFATRLLVSALEKLQTALDMLQGPLRTSSIWTSASRRLVDAFCQRIPDMKEIVRLYKTVPTENLLHKTLASRLLRLYYEIVPRVALAANFDVSPLLADVLRRLGEEGLEPDARVFGIMELENLVSIAGNSPGMRWFAKTSGSTSPFTALLRLLCGDDDQTTPSQQIRSVLETVALENQVVSKTAGLQPLLQALQSSAAVKDVADMDPVWSFVDNCINRCASSPIKYLDILSSYEIDSSSPDSVSLLNVTIVEQLPFATGSLEDSAAKSLTRFLSLYFTAAESTDESASKLVPAVHSQANKHIQSRKLSLKALNDPADTKVLRKHPVPANPSTLSTSAAPTSTPTTIDDAKLRELFHIPPPSSEQDTNVLAKWSTRNVEDLVEDGWASRLIALLADPHVSIRKEALTNILKMAAKIKESSYEDKDQIWLLLSELAESSRPLVDAGPVPSAFTALATHALEVLRNPLHPLYPKINTFLTRGPVWVPAKLPLAHDILHGEPSEDDRYYTEITWLLAYILDSLVTTADLAVLRKQRWFEKILALGSNPYLRANLRTRILRIVYRATTIEAGSTTLVTRFGVVSWLDAQRAACEVPDERALLAALMTRVWDTCDQERVEAWSRGGVKKLVMPEN